MVSFFANIKISIFWPKIMDYSKAFWSGTKLPLCGYVGGYPVYMSCRYVVKLKCLHGVVVGTSPVMTPTRFPRLSPVTG